MVSAQEISRITLIEDESSQSVPSYNYQGTIYVSLKHFADGLNASNNVSDFGNAIEIAFKEVVLRFTSKNPYVLVSPKESGQSIIHQLPTSAHFINNFIFVPLIETVELFNKYSDKSLAVISPGKVIVLAKDQQNMGIIESITLDHSKKGTYIHIKSNILFASQLTHDDNDSCILTLKNVSTFGNSFKNLVPTGFVKHIGVSSVNSNVEIRIKKKSEGIAIEYFDAGDNKELVVHLFERENSPWLERESEHFKVIYKEYH
jgi:hypothetical protein